MKIAFHLFDAKDQTFKKVYFVGWVGLKPNLTSDKRKAKEYFSEKLARDDIRQLEKAKSPTARTLAIRLEEETNDKCTE